ncbi:3506_t:CDS:2 [Acaulospora morrowiae]|uniref:3506_t:CDS:1 n=1 Tax=Acaulospora morrowiae TaxID=94023 RepID=A0A9N8ZU41_9GLOM|nr:3506_t:CDS:2 [Acaulospora morrowiae]
MSQKNLPTAVGKLGLSYLDTVLKKFSQYIWKHCLKWKERVSYMEGKNLSDGSIDSQIEKMSLAFTRRQALEFLGAQSINVPTLQGPRKNNMMFGITF